MENQQDAITQLTAERDILIERLYRVYDVVTCASVDEEYDEEKEKADYHNRILKSVRKEIKRRRS